MGLILGENIPEIYKRASTRPKAAVVAKEKGGGDEWIDRIERIISGISQIIEANPQFLAQAQREQGVQMPKAEVSRSQANLIFDVVRNAMSKIPNAENITVDKGLTMLDQFREQVIEGLLSALNQAGVLNDQEDTEDSF